MSNFTEQWVNIYKSKKYNDSYWTGAFCYKTKEEAIKDLADKENYLTTINIEEMLKLQEQNAKLKKLLTECASDFETYAKEDETCGLEEENKLAKNILPKIYEALK